MSTALTLPRRSLLSRSPLPSGSPGFLPFSPSLVFFFPFSFYPLSLSFPLSSCDFVSASLLCTLHFSPFIREFSFLLFSSLLSPFRRGITCSFHLSFRFSLTLERLTILLIFFTIFLPFVVQCVMFSLSFSKDFFLFLWFFVIFPIFLFRIYRFFHLSSRNLFSSFLFYLFNTPFFHALLIEHLSNLLLFISLPFVKP